MRGQETALKTRGPGPKASAKRWGFVCALGLVAALPWAVSAASYLRTTLAELTQRSEAVVEAEVIQKTYPPMSAGDSFPRTHIDLKVKRVLKGQVPEQITLDIP